MPIYRPVSYTAIQFSVSATEHRQVSGCFKGLTLLTVLHENDASTKQYFQLIFGAFQKYIAYHLAIQMRNSEEKIHERFWTHKKVDYSHLSELWEPRKTM